MRNVSLKLETESLIANRSSSVYTTEMNLYSRLRLNGSVTLTFCSPQPEVLFPIPEPVHYDKIYFEHFDFGHLDMLVTSTKYFGPNLVLYDYFQCDKTHNSQQRSAQALSG